jgi:SnoaL-like domain
MNISPGGVIALAVVIGCFAGPHRVAIEQLLMEYGRAVDNRDFAQFAGLFTDDDIPRGSNFQQRLALPPG